MFPSTASTAALTRTARSTRQSGLKKPRPLRSVSLQEQPDNDFKKITPERQLSTPASTDICSVGNGFPVCEGISAMSALITAQAAADSESSLTDTKRESPHLQGKADRPSFDRQDSNSSYNSCLDSESGSSFYSISRQNSIPSEVTAALHRQRESTPLSFPHHPIAESSSKDTPLDVNSNNIGLNGSYQDDRNDEDFSNIPLITLLTTQGEKVILTGRSMPTILNASKILVREMGASIISMRFEDLNEDNLRQKEKLVNKSVTNDHRRHCETPSPPPPPPSCTQIENPSQKDMKVIRYSKEDLLAFSECEVARQPPANWNILIHTHSDCCLPADKMREYFEAIDFHAHDGTLVTEDRRIRGDNNGGHRRDNREQTVY